VLDGRAVDRFASAGAGGDVSEFVSKPAGEKVSTSLSSRVVTFLNSLPSSESGERSRRDRLEKAGRAKDVFALSVEALATARGGGFEGRAVVVRRVVWLMKQAVVARDRATIAERLIATRCREFIESFADSEGFVILREWCEDMARGKNTSTLVRVLQAAKAVPGTRKGLSETRFGFLLKRLRKHEDERVRELARETKKKWSREIEDDFFATRDDAREEKS
jgi:galactokinase/mevalonate kinase-like predicted kinase